MLLLFKKFLAIKSVVANKKVSRNLECCCHLKSFSQFRVLLPFKKFLAIYIPSNPLFALTQYEVIGLLSGTIKIIR